MTRFAISMALLLVLCCGASSSAADSVAVHSMTVPRGATGVEIPVKLSNDSRIRIITIPLEFRSVTPGSFITRLGVSFADRLTDSLSSQRIVVQYTSKDGFCQPTGGSAYTGYILSPPDSMIGTAAEPLGLIVSAWSITSSVLPIGSDNTGSIILRMDVTDTSGSFEIDTTCIAPSNRLVFIGADLSVIHPAFSKGVITIDACDCGYHGDLDGSGAIDAVDLGILIDWVFYSIGPPPTDPDCPHVDRGDVDCSGADDAVDISLMIDIVFAGASACEPCGCSPYPTSCP